MEHKHFRIPLRVVFYQEDGSWVAHCLEFDLVGAGTDPVSAFAALDEAISMQVQWSIEKNDMGRLFSPAPATYQQMFAEGEDFTECELQVTFSVQETIPREQTVRFEDSMFRSYKSRGSSGTQQLTTV